MLWGRRVPLFFQQSDNVIVINSEFARKWHELFRRKVVSVILHHGVPWWIDVLSPPFVDKRIKVYLRRPEPVTITCRAEWASVRVRMLHRSKPGDLQHCTNCGWNWNGKVRDNWYNEIGKPQVHSQYYRSSGILSPMLKSSGIGWKGGKKYATVAKADGAPLHMSIDTKQKLDKQCI